MDAEQTKREELIKFIKANDPYYNFQNFNSVVTKVLEHIKEEIDLQIKIKAEENKQQKHTHNPKP